METRWTWAPIGPLRDINIHAFRSVRDAVGVFSRRRVLEWLLDVEDDDEHPERQAALRSGREFVALATREGLVDSSNQERDDFARMIAQLDADGRLAWDYTRCASDPESNPPQPGFFTERELQRAERIRLLPPGLAAARRGASSTQRPGRTRLEPEQVELLGRLVAAARAVEPSRRMFTVAPGPSHGDVITGADIARPVLREDVDELERAQMIRPLLQWEGGMQFVITPLGDTLIDDAADREPVARVEGTVAGYLDSRAFAASYPLALQRWKEAAELLWGPNAATEPTTIGHKLREAVQEFATALVERYTVADATRDVTKTVARLKTVIASAHPTPGSKPSLVLRALIAYWGEVNDLLQRQEHGAQKEGLPLVWEDARLAVFQTAVVMYEIDLLLSSGKRLG